MHSQYTPKWRKKAYTQNIMQETQICGKNFIIRTSNKNRLINGLETCTIIVLSLFLECSFSFIIICGPKKMHSHTHTHTHSTNNSTRNGGKFRTRNIECDGKIWNFDWTSNEVVWQLNWERLKHSFFSEATNHWQTMPAVCWSEHRYNLADFKLKIAHNIRSCGWCAWPKWTFSSATKNGVYGSECIHQFSLFGTGMRTKSKLFL